MGYFLDHGGDGQIRKYRLYYIALNTPVYWTDCDVDIMWGGYRWTVAPIIPGGVSTAPTGATATFDYGDASGTVFAALAAQNGGELALAAIYEAGFLTTNKTAVPDEVVEVFSGRIDTVQVSNVQKDVITFTFMPPALSAAATVPFRLLSTLLRS